MYTPTTYVGYTTCRLEYSHSRLEYSNSRLEYSHSRLEDRHSRLEDRHGRLDYSRSESESTLTTHVGYKTHVDRIQRYNV